MKGCFYTTTFLIFIFLILQFNFLKHFHTLQDRAKRRTCDMASGARGEPNEPNDMISQGIQTKKTCTEYKCSDNQHWCQSKDCEQFEIMKGWYKRGDERLQQPENRDWLRYFLRCDLQRHQKRLRELEKRHGSKATQQKIEATQQTIKSLQAKLDALGQTVESSRSDAPDHNTQTGQQQKNQQEKEPDQNGKALAQDQANQANQANQAQNRHLRCYPLHLAASAVDTKASTIDTDLHLCCSPPQNPRTPADDRAQSRGSSQPTAGYARPPVLRPAASNSDSFRPWFPLPAPGTRPASKGSPGGAAIQQTAEEGLGMPANRPQRCVCVD